MNTKFKLLFVMLLSALCITFTSCSDDDDDKTVDYAKEIAGTYKGEIQMAETPIATNATIIFTRSAENKVTLEMKETIMEMPIDIKCTSDVVLAPTPYDVVSTTEVYRISGETTFQTFLTKINGTVDKAGNAIINITIPEMSIDVVYNGKKITK